MILPHRFDVHKQRIIAELLAKILRLFPLRTPCRQEEYIRIERNNLLHRDGRIRRQSDDRGAVAQGGMAAHIVKEAVLLPEYAAERKRDNDRPLGLRDIPNAALDIGETGTLFGNEGRSVLLLPNQPADLLDAGKNALDALRRS